MTRQVDGGDLHEGDTFVEAVTNVERTIDHFTDPYASVWGDGMRHAHCTDGSQCTIRDHGHFDLVVDD